MKANLIKMYPLAFLLGISFLVLVPNLDVIQTNIMEARNLITAREMVRDNNWIFTTLNGQPRYEKPPLPTWLTASFGAAFGFDNLFILRLPAVLITILLIFYLYRFLNKFGFSLEQNLQASLIAITSFYIFFAGRDNQWDIYCHAFMMVSIYYLYISLIDNFKSYFSITLSILFFGFSFLSKGPVAPYALFLPFILAYFVTYRKFGLQNIFKVIIVISIGCLIGMIWPLYVRFFDEKDVIAAATQESSRWSGYNTRPFYYYWSFFTQSGIWTVPALIGLIYPFMKTRVINLQHYKFSILWTSFSVILLSLIFEKKSRYLLPVLIPLAINTSFYTQYLTREFNKVKNKFELILAYFTFGLIGIIAFAIPIVLTIMVKDQIQIYVFWITGLSIVSLLCSFFIFKGLLNKKFSLIFYSIIGLVCGIMVFGIPISKAYYFNPDYLGTSSIKLFEKRHNIKTYCANGFVPEIVWDYGSIIKDINQRDNFRLPPEKSFGVLINETDKKWLMNKCKEYNIVKLARLDLNHVAKDKKGYNKRLVKEYYIVQKKHSTL